MSESEAIKAVCEAVMLSHKEFRLRVQEAFCISRETYRKRYLPRAKRYFMYVADEKRARIPEEDLYRFIAELKAEAINARPKPVRPLQNDLFSTVQTGVAA